MSYIPTSEYMDHAPDSPEDSPVRINHDDCTAGSDTKGRLYIWRKDNGSVTAYCHHCGLSGYTKGKGYVRRLPNKKAVTVSKFETVYMPTKIEKDVSKWPVEARNWVFRVGIKSEELLDYGIVYSPPTKRVIIPCHNVSGKFVGYQSRRVFDDSSPKYMSKVNKSEELSFMSSGQTNGQVPELGDDTVVLVEDALSCIKTGRVAHAIALVGVHLDLITINYLTERFKHGIIFLDNDNFQVKKRQLELQSQLGLLMDTVKIVRNDRDPKECSRKELLQLLRGSEK